MQIIVKSSKYYGGSYRKKEGVTCNSFSELLQEVNRLYNIAKLEKTDEHITLQVRQETHAARPTCYDVHIASQEKPVRIAAFDLDDIYSQPELEGVRPEDIVLIEPVELEPVRA
jgi:hypothetical protein